MTPRIPSHARTSLPVLACMILLTCTPAPSDQPICETGATQRCDCPGGLSGAQSCRDDGKSWLACQCLPEGSCASNEDCGASRRCDLNSHTCICLPEHHLCQDLCVPDDSVESCGDLCQACPSSDRGVSTCADDLCHIDCDSGYHLCTDTCLADTSPDSCGSLCTPCPTSDHGQAVCQSGSCGVVCDDGYHPCATGCCAWRIEVLDPHPAAGAYVDLALRSDGQVLAASYDLTDQTLRLARESGLTFTLEDMDPGADRGRHMRLALAPDDQPELGYYDAGTLDLRFASLASNTWVHQTVASAGDVGAGLAFVRSANTRHLSFVDSTAAQLWYAQDDGSGFTTRAIATGQAVDTQTAIASTSDGRVLIAFRDRDTHNLMLGTLQQALWTDQIVDDSGDAGTHLSMQLDASGQPVIAYSFFDPPRVELRLASFDGMSWNIDTVDARGAAGTAPTLALHGNIVHISYYDSVQDDVLYARRIGTGATWELFRVFTAGDAGAFSAIKVNALGDPIIAFKANGMRLARW